METETELEKGLYPEKIREDFPILKRKVNGKQLIYLDNAATSQKPRQVIDAITDYYINHNANVHRSIHKLGEEATERYEEAHRKIAGLINAGFEEVVFTRGTTESLNLLAYSLKSMLGENSEILITPMEHHSNLVPWQQVANQTKARLNFMEMDKNGNLILDHLGDLITRRTKIVSITHVSNVLGTINPIKEIAKIVHDNNALLIVDSAQGVPHMPVDVRDMDCDFLAFSAHKMLGPTGIGALYGKKELLEEMQPFQTGGEMVKEVKFRESKWNELPWKFEAGTPNIAGAVGFSAAVDYLKHIGMGRIAMHEKSLIEYAMEKLNEIGNIKIYGPQPKYRSSVVAFNLFNKSKIIHPHDVCAILDQYGIACRGGHHCAMPLQDVLGIDASTRASFYLYNTKAEIDALVTCLNKITGVFN